MEKQNLSPSPHLSGNDDKAKWSLSSFLFCGLLPSIWPRLLGLCYSPWDFQMPFYPSPWLVSIQTLVRSGTFCPVWLQAFLPNQTAKRSESSCQTKYLWKESTLRKSGVQMEDISNSHSSWECMDSTETTSYLCCSSCTSCSGHAGPMQTPPGGWESGLREPSPAETTTPHRKGLLFVLKEQKTNNNSS